MSLTLTGSHWEWSVSHGKSQRSPLLHGSFSSLICFLVILLFLSLVFLCHLFAHPCVTHDISDKANWVFSKLGAIVRSAIFQMTLTGLGGVWQRMGRPQPHCSQRVPLAFVQRFDCQLTYASPVSAERDAKKEVVSYELAVDVLHTRTSNESVSRTFYKVEDWWEESLWLLMSLHSFSHFCTSTFCLSMQSIQTSYHWCSKQGRIDFWFGWNEQFSRTFLWPSCLLSTFLYLAFSFSYRLPTSRCLFLSQNVYLSVFINIIIYM